VQHRRLAGETVQVSAPSAIRSPESSAATFGGQVLDALLGAGGATAAADSTGSILSNVAGGVVGGIVAMLVATLIRKLIGKPSGLQYSSLRSSS
jgi:hypothetical protein